MLGHFELTVPQYDLLRAVKRLGEHASPKNIADEMLVTRGNITGLLQRLKARGLLTTRQDKTDGRSFVCALTGTARGLITGVDRAAASFVSEQLSPFNTGQLMEVGTMMRAMRTHLETMDPDAIASKILE